jgi:hypothetical protein
MAVFYVGCCTLPGNRVAVHRHGKRPVSRKIQEYESASIELITVFEERILPSSGRYAHCVEDEYIKGYARLVGDRLMNVMGNNSKHRSGFVFAENINEPVKKNAKRPGRPAVHPGTIAARAAS